MTSVDKLLAKKLLNISAVKLSPSAPFTWASGWKSPIYTDNRKTLSFPDVRTFVKIELTRMISENFKNIDVIAGVATGAIAQGALIADELSLPYVYVRSAPKDHGLTNLIEGDLQSGQRVVVVEDLISTGGSSLKAVDAVRKSGCEVLGMAAIFTYGFPEAEEKFRQAGVELFTLSNYNAVLESAMESGYITKEELATLKVWRENPSQWMQ
ncbi:MAG: orotate phosphoribosyltransferase [Bacteroidales bacterium]